MRASEAGVRKPDPDTDEGEETDAEGVVSGTRGAGGGRGGPATTRRDRLEHLQADEGEWEGQEEGRHHALSIHIGAPVSQDKGATQRRVKRYAL